MVINKICSLLVAPRLNLRVVKLGGNSTVVSFNT